MRLYAGTSQQFLEDTVQNQIAEKLKAAFFITLDINPHQMKFILGKIPSEAFLK